MSSTVVDEFYRRARQSGLLPEQAIHAVFLHGVVAGGPAGITVDPSVTFAQAQATYNEERKRWLTHDQALADVYMEGWSAAKLYRLQMVYAPKDRLSAHEILRASVR